MSSSLPCRPVDTVDIAAVSLSRPPYPQLIRVVSDSSWTSADSVQQLTVAKTANLTAQQCVSDLIYLLA